MINFISFDPSDCTLHKHRIDIWQFPLDEENTQFNCFLSEDEQERGNRFHFVHHQRRFTTARSMLRLILSRYLGINPGDICFAYNKQGKPSVLSERNLEFNLSHSRDTALLAVGHEFPLGIDLEYFSARTYKGIGEQIFSTLENRYLSNAPTSVEPLCFFNIWAQKEALIKACGVGLSYPTKQFDLLGLPPDDQRIIDPQNKQPWRIVSFMPKMACCAALCFNPVVEEIRFLALDNLNSFS